MQTEISISKQFDSLSLNKIEVAKLAAKLGLHAVALVLSSGASAPLFAAAVPELGADLIGCVGRGDPGQAEEKARMAVTAAAAAKASRKTVTPERLRALWERLRSLAGSTDSSERVRLIAAAAVGQGADDAPDPHDLRAASWINEQPLANLMIWADFFEQVYGDRVVDEHLLSSIVSKVGNAGAPVEWPCEAPPSQVEPYFRAHYPWMIEDGGSAFPYNDHGFFGSVKLLAGPDESHKWWIFSNTTPKPRAGVEPRLNAVELATTLGARVANCFATEKQIVKFERDEYERAKSLAKA